MNCNTLQQAPVPMGLQTPASSYFVSLMSTSSSTKWEVSTSELSASFTNNGGEYAFGDTLNVTIWSYSNFGNSTTYAFLEVCKYSLKHFLS